MMDGPDRFAPLGGDETAATEAPHATTGAAAAAAATDWQPEAPAPEEPPPVPRYRRLGTPAAMWTYRDAAGRPLFAVCRFNAPDGGGGKAILPRSFGTLRGTRGWHWKGPAKPVPLYRLPQLAARPGAPVVVVEGEKAADAAAALFPEHVAVTWQGGARAVQCADWSALAGRTVAVWPDNDAAGRDAAAAIVAALAHAGAAAVAVVEVPRDWPGGWDVADPLPAGASAETLAKLLLAAQPVGDEGGGAAEDDAGPQPPRDPAMPRPFYARAGGIFWADPDDAEGRPLHVCGPLEVVAQTDDGTGWNCGAVLRWPGPCGRVHEWPMPRRMLAGDGNEVRARLLDGGLYLGPSMKARQKLSEYLQRAMPAARVRVVGRLGWHDTAGGRVFVLPDRALGAAEAEAVRLQTERPDVLPPLHQSGDLADWQRAVAAPCRGNSRLLLAVSAAFAAPLLGLLGAEGGGLHFRGGSSIGKSAALAAAGSVWGGGGLHGWLRSWLATANALEAVAAAHCDLPLCLDEIGQAPAEAVAEAAYMLANGAGKGRAARDGSARRSAQWRVLFLSTGEVGLAERLAEARGGAPRRVRAGQEVRVVDVPAEPGPYGLFEDLHGAAHGAAFAEALKDAARRCYGTAGRAFLERLTSGADAAALAEAAHQAVRHFDAQHVPPGANGQVRRVARRFALVAAGGEMAAALGIVPWAPGEAADAAAQCFRAWLARREGGTGAAEDAAAVAAVRHFIGAHDARFETVEPRSGSGSAAVAEMAPGEAASRGEPRPILNRAGWKKRDGGEGWRYLILPETWRREVVAGDDPNAAAAALHRVGYLVPQQAGRWQRAERVPGHEKPVRVYVIRGDILAGDDGASGEAAP